MGMKHPYFKSLIVIFCCLLAQPVWAENFQFEGDYVFSWSGLRIGKMNLKMQQDASDYSVSSQIKTSGVVSVFSDHTSRSQAKGKTSSLNYNPLTYRSDYNSGNKDKVIDLTYNGQGKLLSEVVLPSRGARPEVDESLKQNTMDVLSAFFAMRDHVKESLLSNHKGDIIVPIFDGIRRFDLVATITDANTSISNEGQNIPAVKLNVKRKPFGGFKDKELKRIAKGEPNIELFIEKKNFTVLGVQMSVYGGQATAWVKDSCVNNLCKKTEQVALK